MNDLIISWTEGISAGTDTGSVLIELPIEYPSVNYKVFLGHGYYSNVTVGAWPYNSTHLELKGGPPTPVTVYFLIIGK